MAVIKPDAPTDPYTAINQRFDRLEANLTTGLREIRDALLGTLDKPGLSERTRQMEAWRDSIEDKGENPLPAQLQTIREAVSNVQQWQARAGHAFFFVFTPLFGLVLAGVVYFLWGLWAHSFHIVPGP